MGFGYILIMLLLNYMIFLLIAAIVPNYYLAMMITSLVISFIYPLYSYFRTRRKILSIDFLTSFLFNGVILLTGDLFFFLLISL